MDGCKSKGKLILEPNTVQLSDWIVKSLVGTQRDLRKHQNSLGVAIIRYRSEAKIAILSSPFRPQTNSHRGYSISSGKFGHLSWQ